MRIAGKSPDRYPEILKKTGPIFEDSGKVPGKNAGFRLFRKVR